MMSFSEHTDFTRSIFTMIVSYSVSLLNTRKPSRMACSIISLIRALSFKSTLAPV